MNKKIIIILLGLMINFILIFSIYFFIKSHKTEVVLKTNAGVPYEWRCTITDESVVKITSKYSEDLSGKDVVGGRVAIHYELKGLKKGTSKMICEYYNFTNNIVDRKETYQITVDKNLKVKIR